MSEHPKSCSPSCETNSLTRINADNELPRCPLCASFSLMPFHADKSRQYLQCQTCQLVSVPSAYYLSAEAEKAVYDLHDNACIDAGYRRFLSRCLDPVLTRVGASATGLDFGCGEGAALSMIAKERGVTVENYDLYYFNHAACLARQYSFITLTEVIEHVADARALITQLDSLLVSGGVLGIMTKRVLDRDAFARWHYKNDPTHINFYSIATFEWIATQFKWQLEVVDSDVVIFTKNS